MRARKARSLFFAAAISAAGSFAGDAGRALSRPPEIFAPHSVILFQGDSITHGGRGGDMNHYLGHGYQALIAQCYLARRPRDGLQFVNRAKSGDSTAKLLERWETDAIRLTITERGYGRVFAGTEGPVKLTPDVLSLLVGANDRRDPPGNFEKNLAELLNRSLAANPELKIVLGEPFRCPQPVEGDFAKMQAACARLALKLNIPLIPYQKLFNERLLKANPRPLYWSWDTIHPTYPAHAEMAALWIRTVGDFYRAAVTNTALIPQGKIENDCYDWYGRHERILRRQRQINPEIVLVGDSITHFWAGRESIGEPADSAPHFNKVFSRYRTLNLGYGWDRTQNVLWRLDHGEMDGLKPRLVVLHIGTNNIGGSKNARANSPGEIAEAILRICARIREKAPAARILLMGIFPRGERKENVWRGRAREVNAILRAAAGKLPNTVFLDIGPKLVEKDGTISREIMSDFCHPTPRGYAVWADAIRPYLAG